MPSASSVSEGASSKEEEDPAGISMSRSYSNSSAPKASTAAVTSSPSRESKEKAEEVARKVVSDVYVTSSLLFCIGKEGMLAILGAYVGIIKLLFLFGVK